MTFFNYPRCLFHDEDQWHTPCFSPLSDLRAANKSPLSVLSDGFGSPVCFFFLACSLHLFLLASFSPLLPSSLFFFSSSSSLVSLCLCDMENVVRRNHENKKMCVDPPAPPVRLMVLFVVPQESALSPLIILFFAPPSSAGAQNGLAFPGASGHKRRPRLLQSYQGTNG